MSATTSTTSRALAIAETALILIAPFVYWLMPHDFGSDGYFRLEATRALARGEIPDTPVSLVMPLAALPLYHFGDVVAQFNLFAIMIGLAVFAAVMWRHVSPTLLRRAVLLVLAASMFGHHSQLFFGEVFTALAVTVGLALIATGRFWPALPPLVAGVANSPATLGALAVMSVGAFRRGQSYLKILAPIVASALVVMLEFYLKRGSPFATGYEGDHGAKSIMPYSGLSGFSYPLVFGLLSTLFSFGKGLAFYVPGLWLMLRRTMTPPAETVRVFQRYAGWFVIGLVLIYAKWWAWPGGWFWGPRFFLFACVPASIALAMHLSDEAATPGAKALTLGVLAWSVWVGIDGAVYGQLDMAICNTQPDYEPLCWYSPEFSALFRPFIVAKTLTARETIVFGYSILAGLVLGAPFAAAVARDAIQRATRWRDRPALP